MQKFTKIIDMIGSFSLKMYRKPCTSKKKSFFFFVDFVSSGKQTGILFPVLDNQEIRWSFLECICFALSYDVLRC